MSIDAGQSLGYRPRQAVAGATVTTHFEPIEDPVSPMDEELDRPGG